MNRRRFLKGSVAALGFRYSAILGCLEVLVEPATAQDPATVLTVVQMALSLASLFGGGGPGIADLLNLQTEMLKHISDQLGVIQQSLIVIFDQLEQLKTLVRDVPDQVVLTLYKNKISGLIRHYSEVMSTYAADVKSVGIVNAQSKNASEIEQEVLRGLREARDVLFGYSSELIIPIICAALQTESHAMIMANYPHTNMNSAFSSYKAWLSPFLDEGTPTSLVDQITSLESDVRAKMVELDNFIGRYNGRTCTQDVRIQLAGSDIHVISGRLRSLSKQIDTNDFQTKVTSGYTDLTNAGEKVPNDIIDYKLYTLISTDSPLALSTPINQGLVDSYCPKPFNEMPEQAVASGNVILQALKTARLKYITYKSLHLCAADAVGFIQKLTKDMQQN